MPETSSAAARAYRTLGAVCEGRATEFRVWAPDARQIDLVLTSETTGVARAGSALRPLSRDPNGYWSGRFEDVPPGARYAFRLDGSADRTFPDPASRFQPEGVHAPSEVIDPGRFRWTDHAWAAPPLERLIIYELHVGTFSPEGTYAGAIARLPALADLGVTAIELMPLGDFPGERNWGYDGAAIFAPARCYGRPDDLRALVDAAHRHGLAVVLDVIYNHLGPDGAYANAFSPYYFASAHSSPWGRGVNLDGPHSGEVRRFFIENALHWLDEYHVDALRLDATHEMHDDRPRHFLAELASTVHAQARRRTMLIAEDHRNLAFMLLPASEGGWGLDAAWADDFHHQVRVHVAGDQEGYFRDFTGSIPDLATTMRQGWFYTGQRSTHLDGPRGTDPAGLDPPQFVICIQNHDQVGNRADGSRLHHAIDPAAYRAATALLLLAPQTPLLFMGQEWACSSPFLFFTDHHEELGRQVTEGRRAEFRSFAAFADPSRRAAIPDPQARETFERSRLNWDELAEGPHAAVRRLHQRLIRLRRDMPALNVRARRFTVLPLDEHTIALGYAEGNGLLLVARLSGPAATVHVPIHESGPTLLTTEDPDVASPAAPPRLARSASPDGRPVFEITFHRPGAVVLQCALR